MASFTLVKMINRHVNLVFVGKETFWQFIINMAQVSVHFFYASDERAPLQDNPDIRSNIHSYKLTVCLNCFLCLLHQENITISRRKLLSFVKIFDTLHESISLMKRPVADLGGCWSRSLLFQNNFRFLPTEKAQKWAEGGWGWYFLIHPHPPIHPPTPSKIIFQHTLEEV